MAVAAGGLLRIGELAQRVGLTERTIRYYEEVGLLDSVKRSDGGTRVYTDDDVRRLRFIQKLKGLGLGADDYMTKPFSLGELQARIRALLRRASPRRVSDEVVSGDLLLNLVSRRAFLAGKELTLSPKEFSLLIELVRHQGAVLSRDLLLTRVWGYDYYGDSRTVDVHVRWLREKIEADPAKPQRVVTVRGIGYRFEG